MRKTHLLADCDGCIGGDTEPIAQAAGYDYAELILAGLLGVAVNLDRTWLATDHGGKNFQGWFPPAALGCGISLSDVEVARLAQGEVPIIIAALQTRLVPTPAIRTTLLWLRDNAGTEIYSVSSSDALRVKATLEIQNILDLIRPRGIFSAPTLALPGKPDPAVYLHALEQCGVPIQSCFAIEDSTSGGAAAEEAGLDWLGCVAFEPRETRNKKIGELLELGCSGVFSTWDPEAPRGCLALLKTLGWVNA